MFSLSSSASIFVSRRRSDLSLLTGHSTDPAERGDRIRPGFSLSLSAVRSLSRPDPVCERQPKAGATAAHGDAEAADKVARADDNDDASVAGGHGDGDDHGLVIMSTRVALGRRVERVPVEVDEAVIRGVADDGEDDIELGSEGGGGRGEVRVEVDKGLGFGLGAGKDGEGVIGEDQVGAHGPTHHACADLPYAGGGRGEGLGGGDGGGGGGGHGAVEEGECDG
ncbi:hypothetical protein Syun_011071 [Stephania yunnanensis]|uniref:Uncharacterized protein n=1 Tax=Stephania yunnanensis TaxID=152371 RepID=A0AAP0PI55_9MAGN